FAGSFLQNQEIVGTQKSHAGRLVEARNYGRHRKIRVDHSRTFRRWQRFRIDRQVAEEAVHFVIGPCREEQRAALSARDSEAELQTPQSIDGDRVAGGVVDFAEELAGIEVEGVDRAVAGVADQQRVVELA